MPAQDLNPGHIGGRQVPSPLLGYQAIKIINLLKCWIFYSSFSLFCWYFLLFACFGLLIFFYGKLLVIIVKTRYITNDTDPVIHVSKIYNHIHLQFSSKRPFDLVKKVHKGKQTEGDNKNDKSKTRWWKSRFQMRHLKTHQRVDVVLSTSLKRILWTAYLWGPPSGTVFE